MDLKEIMSHQYYAVLGDTLNEDKYACRIKREMTAAGYTVYPVGKELASLNDIEGPLDIIDLCIHPVKGLKLLQENRKDFRAVIIQPGADSPELIAWLEQEKIPYLQGCLLVGLRTYPRA